MIYLISFVLVLSLVLPSVADAAAITWSDPISLVENGVDVFPDMTGIILEAFNCNGPAANVGGIEFLADADTPQYSDLKTVLFNKTGASAIIVADPAPTDAGLKTITSKGRFAPGLVTLTFKLTNLVSGKPYQIQMITCDNRIGSSGNESFHYSDGLGNDSLVFARRDDVWITGNFIADSDTQDIQMVPGVCVNFLMNAYVLSLMPPLEIAMNPYPADEATDVVRDVICSWIPGSVADKHDVYFGAIFNDVNDADRTNPLGVLVSQGQDANTYDPVGILEYDQTYYWRNDKVNDQPDYTIFKGDVWSFTVEPFAYPIDVNNITATASSSNKADEGPENTINGSGLDDDDLHSSENTAMWLSNIADPNATWIQYEFDRVHKLYQMWVWNYNSSVELIVGFSIKEATIEYSVDGTNWTILGTTHEFARGPGSAGYAPNTTVDLGGVAAKYVRITANSNWGGIVNQYGLSEVRFLYIPVWPREPYPASGATDMDVDNVTLSWRAGREAALHDMYLSTDQQAVIDETISPVSVPAGSSYANYDTGELDLGQTYYGKIVEVNEVETPITWQGDVWNFSTTEYLVVDDFEDYNDFEPDKIFDTWIDGWEVPTNGSQVGSDMPPFAEQTIVHGGKQSMQLNYDNTTASYSEATADIANLAIGQDWTKHGVQALVLYFSGIPNNTGQLYVKINYAKVVYEAEPAAISLPFWTQWNIDLSAVGTDLTQVKTLSIGVDGAGAQGTIYIDNIRLYRQAPEPVVPQDPGTEDLVTYYALENNTQDGSGNGLDGVAIGGPQYVAGMQGMGMLFDGFNDCVDLGNKPEFNFSSGSFSITLWANISGWTGNWDTLIGNRDATSGFSWLLRRYGETSNLTFSVWGTSGSVDPKGWITPKLGEWHHITAVYDVEAGKRTVYIDGLVDVQIDDSGVFAPSTHIYIGARPDKDEEPEFYFNGILDEVRIYKKALSAGEILYIGTGK